MVCSGIVFAYCLQLLRFDFSLQKETKVLFRIHHFPKARHICFILWFLLLESILPEIPRLLCREDVLSTNSWWELGRSEASEGCFHVWLRYLAYRTSVRKHPTAFLLLFPCGQNFLSFLPVPLTSHQRSPTVPFL